MNSVLKYPGSKNRIADWIISFMPSHHSYLEPFAGSLAVLFNKTPSKIETVNDLDEDIVNLFQLIRNNPSGLAEAISLTPYSRSEYEDVFIKAEGDSIEKARRFLVKCWQSFGFRQNHYKVGWKRDIAGREAAYALKAWNSLPGWVMEAATRLKDIQIENMDAVELIKQYNSPGVLIYCDPPYVLSTRQGKHYRHEMTDSEHIRLIEAIQNHNGPVLLSGYDNAIYQSMLSEWHMETINARASHNKPRLECLWMNFKPHATLFDLA